MESTQVQDRLELNCLIHGEYQKLPTEKALNCPHCEQEQVQKECVAEATKTKVSTTVSLVDVTVNCDEHGETLLKVPAFMRDRVKKCPTCVEVKRLRKLAPKIEALIEREIRHSGIPTNCIGLKFAQMDATRSPKQQPIVMRLIKYIRDLESTGSSEGAKNILLTGNMGTGKTAYASALLQGVITRSLASRVSDENDLALKGSLSVLFISEPSLIQAITATWGHGATEKTKDLIDRLATKSILCIDDVGATVTTQTHLLDAYAAIIDERYKRKLPTIITSNLSHEDIRLSIGARSADRLMEKNRIIIANFDWNGYRGGQLGTNEVEMF